MASQQHLRDKLRKTLQSERAALSLQQTSIRSSAICKRVETLFGNANSIAGYQALGAEVDLSEIASHLSQTKRQYHVPVVLEQHQMKFAPVDESTSMKRNQYGIDEPLVDPQSLIGGMQLDLVLVPLVGFDEQCHRMGMGGGYYDRCFEQRKSLPAPPLLVGVAYECQCVDHVPVDCWDVPLDYVVTEERIVCRES